MKKDREILSEDLNTVICKKTFSNYGYNFKMNQEYKFEKASEEIKEFINELLDKKILEKK